MFGALSKYAEVPPFVEVGYEPQTTFWGDFGVADVLGGASAIKDTYKRSFDSYKDDKVYGTELAMVLNWKSWEHASTNRKLAELYSDLYYKLREYILDNWKDEKLSYYLKVTD